MPSKDFVTWPQVYECEIEEVIKRRKRLGSANYTNADPPCSGLPKIEEIIERTAQHRSSDFELSAAISDSLQSLDDASKQNQTSEGVENNTSTPYRGLVGLALSGGGIRSATFNLGLIQALERVGVLQFVDYLSTVSGGGYIGSCLSSLYSGSRVEPMAATVDLPFFFAHERGKRETSAFRHLRNHSEFLAPDGKKGIIRIPALILRGILINILIISPWIIFAALLTSYRAGNIDLGSWSWVSSFPLTLVVGGLFLLYLALYPFRHMYFQKSKYFQSSGWQSRDKGERLIAAWLAITLALALLESQPHLVAILTGTQNGAVEDLIKAYIETFRNSALGSAVLFLVSAIAGKTLTDNLSRALNRYLLYIIGALGIFAVWLAYMWLSLKVTVSPGDQLVYLLLTIAAILLIYTILTVDVNFLSLHRFYRDRLSRAYIFRNIYHPPPDGKSENPIAIVQPNDEQMLSALNPSLGEQSEASTNDLLSSGGPYQLINATLNVNAVGSASKADGQIELDESYKNGRHGDLFLFSKYFVGSETTGYCATEVMERATRHLNLATAMAISGAAISPNMGRATNRLLAFTLSLLNLRLDYWLPNPNTASKIRKFFGAGSPTNRPRLFYLFREMFGMMSGSTRYVNLSDGGHIENIGLYELLRRRCQLIFIGDGEADKELTFSSLNNALRMAQIDMGINVEMDGLDEIRNGEQNYAIGTIFYSDDLIGKLIYFKSSMIGDASLRQSLGSDRFRTSPRRDDNEMFDLYTYMTSYRIKNPDFPHESTGDQFFDEEQFEAYRALGYEVAMSSLRR